MKAVVCTKYGSPDVLQLMDVEKPLPGRLEVCVKIYATAVTASDCIIRGFRLPFWHPMGFMMGVAIGFNGPRQPILGIVFSGVVESLGAGVTRFKKGDEVFGWELFPGFGAYAEYKCIKESGMIIKKPDNMNFVESSALIYGGLLALAIIKKTNIHKGSRVLIYGASGSIGTSAVQLAKYYGAEVTGVCGTTNLDLVKSLGADEVMDYTKEDAIEKVYDIIIDAVGKKKTSKLKQACRKALVPGGRYISIDDGAPKNDIGDLNLLKELAEAGKLKSIIDKTYPIDKIAAAHEYADKGHKKGNVIITVFPDSQTRS